MKDYVTEWMERPPKEKGRPHRFGLEEFYNAWRPAPRFDIRPRSSAARRS